MRGPIRYPRLSTLAMLAASMVAWIEPALANVCRSIEAELATMTRAPSAREQQLAGRSAAEAARVYAYMRSIGCDRQTFLFFGQPPPPECAGYRARLAQLQAASQASSGYSEPRRRYLMSMLVSYNCRTTPAGPRRSEPLTAGLFDNGSRKAELDTDNIDGPRIESRIRGTSGKAVCVRMCDGYYFPLHLRGASLRDDGDAACQALCPAAETRIFFAPGEIETARAPDGESYTDIENAFRYRKSYDASCSCRRPEDASGDRRTTILNPDDRPGGRGFDVTNPESYPDEDLTLRGMTPIPGKSRDTRLFGNRPPPEPPAPPQPPPDIPADRLVAADQGEIKELRGKDGVTRTVRIIAPELSRAPEAAKAPSTQGRVPAP